MARAPRRFDSVAQALCVAIEEEYSGEGFFAALVPALGDARQKAMMEKLVTVERLTAAALAVDADRLGVTFRPPSELRAEGASEAADWLALRWEEMLDAIIRDYPVYLEEFAVIARSGLPGVDAMGALLVDHEQAIIDFAVRERAGRSDSSEPLEDYLHRLALYQGKGEARARVSR